MAYEKTNWIDGVTRVSAENMNKIEKGIEDLQSRIDHPLEFDWDGTSLGVRLEGDTEYIYVDLKGDTGDIENLTSNHVTTALGYNPISPTQLSDKVKTDVPINAKFTDTNTTYSEITTAEIDTGTASTLRTITGRRVKYILDKVQGWIGGLTKSDVGLGNVDNVKQATKTEHDVLDTKVTSHLVDYTSPHQYDDEGEETEYQGVRYRLVIINGEPFLEVVAI